MKAPSHGPRAAQVMTAARAIAGLSLVLALAGCHETPPPGTAPAADSAPVAVVASAPSDDPIAAAKTPAAAAAAQTQASEDLQDNARSHQVALQLIAHADWLARQAAICGPGDAAMQARYAARQGPPDAGLRDLKVACMAKDIASQALNDAQARHGGVSDTGSL